jgi:hypothetical protein
LYHCTKFALFTPCMKLATYTLLLTLSFFTASAQLDSSVVLPRPKVGIFVPLYLDEAFDADGELRSKTSIPKNVLAGLEFYSGVRLALDSLQEAGAGVEVFVIDTKDKSRTLQQAIDQDIPDASLLIGMMQGSESVSELRTLAEVAHKRNIPLISATYPNDGGINDNPSLVILNSTLKTHAQATYRYLQNNYFSDNIVVFRKPGTQEDKIKTILEDANNHTGGHKLNWKIVDLPDNASSSDILPYLDSTRNNVCYCASLDQSFGTNLLRRLSSFSPEYTSTVIGMPTWESYPLTRTEFKGLEVIYTTPFVTSSGANPRLVSNLANKFKARSRSRASDMVYRGYEVTLRYVSNMLSHVDYIVNLSDHTGTVFTDFDIQPVKVKSKGDEPDYYENMKIYFVKKIDGQMKGVY